MSGKSDSLHQCQPRLTLWNSPGCAAVYAYTRAFGTSLVSARLLFYIAPTSSFSIPDRREVAQLDRNPSLVPSSDHRRHNNHNQNNNNTKTNTKIARPFPLLLHGSWAISISIPPRRLRLRWYIMSVYDRSRQIIRLILRRDGVFVVVIWYIEKRGLGWTSVLSCMRCTVGVLFDVCEFLFFNC